MAASIGGDIDRWIEITSKCQYLPENDLKVRGQTCRKLRGAEDLLHSVFVDDTRVR